MDGINVQSLGLKAARVAVRSRISLSSIGLKHCSHCKGTEGPCQCAFGCPHPSKAALRKSQCYPHDKRAYCHSCGSKNFEGSRLTCQACPNVDLCQTCYDGGLHDNTHPFCHIAAVGRLPVLLQPRCDTSAAPPIPVPPNKQQHHFSISSSVSSSGSTAASTAASTASVPSAADRLRQEHAGIYCDSCGVQNLQGNRFTCQTCDGFDLCQPCFNNNIHDRHAFAVIATEGATPIPLPNRRIANSQAAMASPYRANLPQKHQRNPADVRHQTLTAATPSSASAPHGNEKLSEVGGPDATPANDVIESSTTFSSSSASTSQQNHRENQQTVDDSRVLDTSSRSLRAPQPSDQVPYPATTDVPLQQNAEATIPEELHRTANCDGTQVPYSATNDVPLQQNAQTTIQEELHRTAYCDGTQVPYSATTDLPLQQNVEATIEVLHRTAYCDGPQCRGATHCIAGPRYTCANCPPSFDLCQSCYTSRAAHDISHSFKRFDKADLTSFVLCSPQVQQSQQQQQEQQQARHEQHPNVFCNGARCRGATQCIVGPRYSCADCPTSIDLCQACYTSKAAHNISHSFKRFDKAGVTYVWCPPQMQLPQQQQQQQQPREEQHHNVFCDGPRCCESAQFIVGPRYACADCPPSFDLCHKCYTSQSAHTMSHSFMRFDRAGSSSFVIYEPLTQEQPHQNARQVHRRVPRQASMGQLGGSQVDASPPDRPATNAAN